MLASERRALAAEGVAIDTGEAAVSDDGSSARRLALLTSVLRSLDDQSKLGERGSDGEFVQVVRELCAAKPSAGFGTVDRGGGSFTIRHYAGAVSYQAEGFVAKNTDKLSDDLQALFLKCDALASLLPLLAPPPEASSSAASLAPTRGRLPCRAR